MKRLRNSFIAFTLILASLFMYPVDYIQAASSSPSVLASSKALYVNGSSYTIKVKDLKSGADVFYESSDKTVATVSEKGVVKPIRGGEATIAITICQNNKVYNDTLKISVKPKQPKITSPVATWKDGTKELVNFGSYPQTMVPATDELINATYDSNGDTTIAGVKYRRLSREDAPWYVTYKPEDYTSDNYYWSKDDPYLYFRYDPIVWRVLSNDGKEVFLLSEYCLDSEGYEEDSKKDATWEDCTIRQWLNNTFLNTAFSKNESKSINNTIVYNKDSRFGTRSQVNTIDKVFLISNIDIINKKYNLAENITFEENGGAYYKGTHCYTTATDYAKACGIEYETDYDDTLGMASYLLRSQREALNNITGRREYFYVCKARGILWQACVAASGIRPAIHLSTAAIK